jgi:hypothetical protein
MNTENLEFGKAETPMEGFLTKVEVAMLLNRSVKMMSNWMHRGILPYYNLKTELHRMERTQQQASQ